MSQRILIILSMFIAATLFVGCVSDHSATTEPKTAFTVEENRGEYLYNRRCILCHAAHSPGRFSDAEWIDIMEDMAREAKLSASDKNAVIAYVLAANQ